MLKRWTNKLVYVLITMSILNSICWIVVIQFLISDERNKQQKLEHWARIFRGSVCRKTVYEALSRSFVSFYQVKFIIKRKIFKYKPWEIKWNVYKNAGICWRNALHLELRRFNTKICFVKIVTLLWKSFNSFYELFSAIYLFTM